MNTVEIDAVLRLRDFGLERLDEDKAIIGFASKTEAKLSRWLDFAKGALLFLTVPGDPESGWFYVSDRARAVFYSLVLPVEGHWGGFREDEFDHLTGDQVLRVFAQSVQQHLRATDVFGRYGGEKFVKICRHTTLAGAVADAEHLRERISALEVPLPKSVGQLTVSIGVAEYRPGETIMQTFARADLALYRAKAAGRNRVES